MIPFPVKENLKVKMNLKQNVQPRSSINGFGRRRVDNISSKPESKMHTGKSTSGNFSNGGKV